MRILFTTYLNVARKSKEETRRSKEKVQVFPNPAKDIINIESEKEIKQIKIYDLRGNVMLIIKEPENNKRIDISNLSKGVYIGVVILKDNRDYKVKIVKL